MNTAFYIKSLPHAMISDFRFDRSTGERSKWAHNKPTDYRTYVYQDSNTIVPLDEQYQAVTYFESSDGNIMKPVGRPPMRVSKLFFSNKEAYDQNKNVQIMNYYQSLYLHNPQICQHYKFNRPLKFLYFDIETITLGDGRFPDPYDPKHRYPICMLGYQIDSNPTEVLVFDFHAYMKGSPDSDAALLGRFMQILQVEDPDVIVTYNGYDFDIPYMATRCMMIDSVHSDKRFKGPMWNAFVDSLCRKPYTSTHETEALRTYIKDRIMYVDRKNPNMENTRPQDAGDFCGRMHYDIFAVDVVQDQKISGIKDKKMKTLAKHHNIIDIVEVGDDITNTLHLFQQDYDRLIDYQKSDVMITHGLCDIYFPLNITIAEMLQVPLNMILEKGRGTVANTYMIKEELANNMVPLEGNDDRRRHEALYHLGRTYQGAIVGIMKNGKMITDKDEDAHIYLRQSWKQDFKCLDDLTQVLTPRGWKYQHELGSEEPIMTWEPVENKLEFQNPDEINRYEVTNHPMISFENTYLSIMMTENHRQYYWSIRNNPDKLELREASKLPAYINIPVSSNLPGHEYSSTRDKYLMIIAWIITEGNIRKSDIVISQRHTVNPEHIERIRNLLNIADVTYTEDNRKNRPDTEFRILSEDKKKIMEVMQNRTRRIPNIVFQMSIECRKEFIYELVKGDGHHYDRKNSDSYVFVTKYYDLAVDFQLLCHLTSHRCIISDEYTDKRNNAKWYYCHFTENNTASITMNADRPTKKDVYSVVKYTGIVWCPTVRNKAFMARRNGKIFITGNSMYPSSIVQFNLGPDTTKLIYDYVDPTWVENFNDPNCKAPMPTMERVIPPRWKGELCGEISAPDSIPSAALWKEYEAWLKASDYTEWERKFSTRFEHHRDSYGIRYLYVYFPDSRLNAIIHLSINMDTESFLRRKVVDLFTTRDKFKKMMKDPAATPEQKSGFNSNQNAVKVIMNSLYGISGNERGSADVSLAIAITGLCRYCTTLVINYMNKNYNNAVVEIDTDGLIVNQDISEDEVNEYLCNKIVEDTGFNLGKYMILEKENFDRMYIYRMKNYILLEEDGTKTKHGVTMKASSHHKMYDECIEEVSDFVLSDDFVPYEDIQAGKATDRYWNRYGEIVRKYTVDVWNRPITDFVKKAKLSHAPEHYLKKTPNSFHSQLIRMAQSPEFNISIGKDTTLFFTHASRPDRKYDLYIDGNDENNKELKQHLDKARYTKDVEKILERFHMDIAQSRDVISFI